MVQVETNSTCRIKKKKWNSFIEKIEFDNLSNVLEFSYDRRNNWHEDVLCAKINEKCRI